jgi:hypothetical protein
MIHPFTLSHIDGTKVHLYCCHLQKVRFPISKSKEALARLSLMAAGIACNLGHVYSTTLQVSILIGSPWVGDMYAR